MGDRVAVKSSLLSLVFTDLVDSTALKMRLGDLDAGGLIERHQERVRALSVETGGREVDTAGDGFFLTFETPSAAVTFALRLQQIHHDEPELPKVRVGVHLGEVSERTAPAGAANPLFIEGLAVDLAGRIQSLAQPGQVLMSSPVLEAAQQRLKGEEIEPQIRWRTHGRYRLKGIRQPVEIGEAGFEDSPLKAPPDSEKARRVRVIGLPRGVALAAGVALLLGTVVAVLELVAPGADPGPPAIAVLPFDDLNDDPEQALFAQGLAEDLTTRLASWRGFPVIARNSSFEVARQYQGTGVDIARAGEALGARYIVEGSVRRASDRVRISVQLIDATTGHHIWADTYDRQFSEILRLQDEISTSIVGAMHPNLLLFESERAMHQDPDDLGAWSNSQRGWWHLNQETQEGNARAQALFERAIELEPRWGWPHAGLALVHFKALSNGWTASPETAVADLLRSAETAVALDDGDPFGHHALGHAYAMSGQSDRMIGAFELSAELNPSDATASKCLGAHLAFVGQSEEAIEHLDRALSISPRDPRTYTFLLSMSWAHFSAGRYAEALEWAEKSIQQRPNAAAYQVAAASYTHLGKERDARASVADMLRLQPDLSFDGLRQFFAAANSDFVERMFDGLRKAGFIRERRWSPRELRDRGKQPSLRM